MHLNADFTKRAVVHAAALPVGRAVANLGLNVERQGTTRTARHREIRDANRHSGPADEQRMRGEFRTRTLSQKLPNLREKLTRAVRLRHKIIAARCSGSLFISAQGIRRDRDNWY